MRFVSSAIGFLLMAACWPGISGLATTPRWDVGVLIAFSLLFAAPARMTAAHWAGLATIGTLVATLAWSSDQGYGVDAAAKLIVVGVAFAWGAALVDPVPFIGGAAVGLAVSSMIAIAQWFGWHGIESYASPAGLFFNGNRLAEVSVIVLAACLARRLWWAVPGLLPAIVIPYSRGAWLTAGIVGALWTWSHIRTFERFVICAIGAMLVLLAAMTATIWRTEQFGMDALAERIAMWSYTIGRLDWFGHGLGSFAADGPLIAWGGHVSRAVHPHNEWLWLAYEGGLAGCGLSIGFAITLARCCRDGNGGLHLLLVAIGIESLFAMPFHDPATVLFAAVVAGHLAGAGSRVRDAAHAGGMALREGRAVYGSRGVDGRAAQGVSALSV